LQPASSISTLGKKLPSSKFCADTNNPTGTFKHRLVSVEETLDQMEVKLIE